MHTCIIGYCKYVRLLQRTHGLPGNERPNPDLAEKVVELSYLFVELNDEQSLQHHSLRDFSVDSVILFLLLLYSRAIPRFQSFAQAYVPSIYVSSGCCTAYPPLLHRIFHITTASTMTLYRCCKHIDIRALTLQFLESKEDPDSDGFYPRPDWHLRLRNCLRHH